MRKEWEKAIVSGNVDDVRSLLDTGADVNALDRYGQTAVMKAAHKGHAEIVRLLIERGADLNRTAKFGLTALMLAVIANHPEVVELLIAGGANTQLRGGNRTAPFFNKTALELAVQMEHTKCEEILLRER